MLRESFPDTRFVLCLPAPYTIQNRLRTMWAHLERIAKPSNRKHVGPLSFDPTENRLLGSCPPPSPFRAFLQLQRPWLCLQHPEAMLTQRLRSALVRSLLRQPGSEVHETEPLVENLKSKCIHRPAPAGQAEQDRSGCDAYMCTLTCLSLRRKDRQCQLSLGSTALLAQGLAILEGFVGPGSMTAKNTGNPAGVTLWGLPEEHAARLPRTALLRF